MAKVARQGIDVDSLLERMGGEAVPEGMSSESSAQRLLAASVDQVTDVLLALAPFASYVFAGEQVLLV